MATIRMIGVNMWRKVRMRLHVSIYAVCANSCSLVSPDPELALAGSPGAEKTP